MGRPTITEKGRNGTEARSPGKCNSPKFLRNSVGEVHQCLFPELEADLTALMQKEEAHSSQYPFLSSFLRYLGKFIVLRLYGI